MLYFSKQAREHTSIVAVCILLRGSVQGCHLNSIDGLIRFLKEKRSN